MGSDVCTPAPAPVPDARADDAACDHSAIQFHVVAPPALGARRDWVGLAPAGRGERHAFDFDHALVEGWSGACALVDAEREPPNTQQHHARKEQRRDHAPGLGGDARDQERGCDREPHRAGQHALKLTPDHQADRERDEGADAATP
jgi:hypothetical protein